MSEFKVKYPIIITCVILCIIPLFFGVFINLMFFSKFGVLFASIIIIGIVLLFFLGIAIGKYAYNEESLKIMGEHDLISALIKKNNYWVLFFIFPLTMVMEEFIFRYYSIGILHFIINLGSLESIVISSIIFALYHLHFWFKLKNKRITIIYISYSFFLGLLNGFVLLTIGLIFCILIHYLLAFILYYNISKKIKRFG